MIEKTDALDDTSSSSKRVGGGVGQEHHHASENFSKFMDCMAKWIEKITTPEFLEFQRQRIGYVLAYDFETELSRAAHATDNFRFDEDIENQHKLMTSFLHLFSSAQVLSQCEHYFKRYPFGGDPISREDHARNMCEFYLGNVYILRSRLKLFLNSFAKVCPELRRDISNTLKSFDRTFDWELRMRNGVTHHEPFADITTEKLSLMRLLARDPTFKDVGLDREHLRTYRKFVSSWVRRVRQRSDTVKLLIDEIAGILAEKTTFLANSDPKSSRSE